MKNTNAPYYHTLATKLGGSYSKLKKLSEKYSDWKVAWKQELGSLDTEESVIANYEKLRESDISIVLQEDSSYPQSLKEITNPPFGLYVRGNLPNAEKPASARLASGRPHIAIVGTRRATKLGLQTAHDFGHALASAGCVVVSGLALGLDASGHKGCVDEGGQTIAVLGGGVDKISPATNAKLAKKILENHGAIISEYPPETKIFPANFLQENRIVSGLSRGVLVIEAPERSGSLATARFALEQNRDVYVVPGPINHPNYAGSHALIRQGATLVTKPEDILEDIGLELNATLPDVKTLTNEVEQKIVEVLRDTGGVVTIDEIVEKADISISEANQSLTMLTVRGIVTEDGGGYRI